MDKKEALELWLQGAKEDLEKDRSELAKIKTNKEKIISRYKYYIELLDEWLTDENISEDVKEDLSDIKRRLDREINEGIEREIKKLESWVKSNEFIKEKLEQLIKQ